MEDLFARISSVGARLSCKSSHLLIKPACWKSRKKTTELKWDSEQVGRNSVL